LGKAVPVLVALVVLVLMAVPVQDLVAGLLVVVKMVGLMVAAVVVAV
jgi:hypothetical protein